MKFLSTSMHTLVYASHVFIIVYGGYSCSCISRHFDISWKDVLKYIVYGFVQDEARHVRGKALFYTCGTDLWWIILLHERHFHVSYHFVEIACRCTPYDY